MTTSSQPPPAEEQLPSANFAGWVREQAPWARWLERLSLALEAPVNRLTGTTQLNPFYHTGTIAFFLFLIVGVTGFYLYIFFQYGFDASYAAVQRVEDLFIGRIVRALHRYASGALVITTLLHALRMLFMERFRGPRWLAWLTGVFMTVLLWGAGVTGYWMIGDERAQIINESFLGFLAWSEGLTARFANWLVLAEESGESWPLFLTITWLHILLYVIVGIFFYLHIRRLQRAKFLPDIPWVAGMGIVLVLGSLIFPLGMLPQADSGLWPARVTIDPIFLFFLPALNRPLLGWLIWGGIGVITLWLTLLPWLPRRGKRPLTPPVSVLDERCTGCTRCATDCPYNALTMVEQPEGSPYKYLAVAHPELCVSCGICLGSCLDDAITLGQTPPEDLKALIQQRITFAQARSADDVEIVFTCERFAHHSAAPYLAREVAQVEATHAAVEVIAVPCTGTISPDLMIAALNQGAAEVRVIGCPPDDCAHREGNLWAEARLTRERPPRLKHAYANVPISAIWLPPDQFEAGLAADVRAEETNWLETRRMFEMLTWRNLIPPFVLLALVLLVQVALSDVGFRPLAPGSALVQVILTDVADPLGDNPAALAAIVGDDELALQLLLDGEVVSQRPFSGQALASEAPLPFFAEEPLPTGEHQLVLQLLNTTSGSRYLLSEQSLTLTEGEIVRLTFKPDRLGGCRGDDCFR